MGHHDEYGKRVLRLSFGSAFSDAAPPLCFPGGGKAYIDGVIDNQIAVEVEARNNKQIRVAILDLICHPLPKKTARIDFSKYDGSNDGAERYLNRHQYRR